MVYYAIGNIMSFRAEPASSRRFAFGGTGFSLWLRQIRHDPRECARLYVPLRRPVNHAESTLTESRASADSKRLTEKLTPLESTLTKKPGGEGSPPRQHGNAKADDVGRPQPG